MDDDVTEPVVYELDRYARSVRIEELRDARESLEADQAPESDQLFKDTDDDRDEDQDEDQDGDGEDDSFERGEDDDEVDEAYEEDFTRMTRTRSSSR